MARSNIVRATNKSGRTLKAGKLVYISGYNDDSSEPKIDYASNDDSSKMPAIGALRQDVENNQQNIQTCKQSR